MKKFRNEKAYKAKEYGTWAVHKGTDVTTRDIRTTDKFIYISQENWMIQEDGAFRIDNANNYVDKFEPYITAEEWQKYKDCEMRSAERAMQAILSNENLITSADFNMKAVARTACQMASALVREMIDEEYYDEKDL